MSCSPVCSRRRRPTSTAPGCVREGHEALYDIIAHAMVLEQYEGRCVDNAAQALQSVPPIVRQMLTQLKLVCAYEGGDS